MKTYVINLPHRNDRLEQMKVPAILSENPPITFPATDGSQFAFEKSKRMRGHMGCWDSHRRLMEKISKESHIESEMTLILEDDCDFNDKVFSFSEYLKELPDDWDLLYLGGINQDAPESHSEHLDLAKNILQTHAYIIRDKFIPILLETLTNHRWKADLVFSEAIKKGKCFICNPPIAVQRESYSDINHQ